MATDSFTVPHNRTTDLKTIALKSHRAIFEGHIRLWMVGFLIAADLISLSSAIFVAYQTREVTRVVIHPTYIEIYSLLAITMVIMFARKGLYPGVGMHYVDELRLMVSSTSFTFLVILAITFVLKTTNYYSRVTIIIAWLLSLVFIPLSRYMTRRLLIRIHLWGEPVVIIGNSRKILPLAEHFEKNLQLGLRPVAVLWDDQCANCDLDAHTPVSICTIKMQARNLSLKTALVVIDDLNEIDQLVERFRTIFHRVILIKDKNGSYGLDGLEFLDFSSVLGLQVKNNLLNPWSQALKRLIDVLASFLGMVLLAPMFVLIAILIQFDSPGRIFYRQLRLGRNGQAFKLLKFRTMQLNADKVLADALARDPALKQEWDSYQKLKNDPRITRVGKFLRKFSLDELPQLWNIARAEMSLVGPRPIIPKQRDLYGEAFGNYIQVTPGMTGLWQVSGRNQTTFARRAELDNEYIQRWSLWLDIYILAKTIKVVFWQKGAY